MKPRKLLTIALLATLATPLVGHAAWDWEGRFPYGIVPIKLSVVKPIQIPIPWYGYRQEASEWGIYSVYGIDFGLESSCEEMYGLSVGGFMWESGAMAGLDVALVSIRRNAYGLQLGGGAVAKDWAYGWQLGAYTYGRGGASGLQTGILNMAGAVRGVQLGVANSCHDLKGVQVGLINLNFGGPLVFFPVVNAAF